LLPGDRVAVKRSAGRILELQEEAVILGVCNGRLFYRLVSQKSEGGSLTEGGGRAWFWDESEVVDNGLQLIGKSKCHGIELPLLDRFKCKAKGGLRVIFKSGAVIRSDLEIFEGSSTVGTVPFGTIIPRDNIDERRVNSCGVVRYLIKYETSVGWISGRIRGGKEEAIVEPVNIQDATASKSENIMISLSTDLDEKSYVHPEESARVWYEKYQKSPSFHLENYDKWAVKNYQEFQLLLSSGTFIGMSPKTSDALLATALSKIADYSPQGNPLNCSFVDILSPISFAIQSLCPQSTNDIHIEHTVHPGVNEAATEAFSKFGSALPPIKAILARVALLRALNRRANLALPWLPLKPPHDGGAILGGLSGFGTTVDRSGRSRSNSSLNEWPKSSFSVGSRLRSGRRLFFTSVKRSLLDSIVNVTTTPTPLSHDEYELPREVRTVRVNRLKAKRAMLSDDCTLKRKFSVFSQLQHEMRNWSGAALRRGHVAKGHGGQKRAFKVKLVGEGVNDYSGPYREVFTDALREVTELDKTGHGTLGVLEPSPNQTSSVGEDQSLYLFSAESTMLRDGLSIEEEVFKVTDDESALRNNFASYIGKTSESTREVEDSLIFLGKLVGTACRHGIPVDLPLPLLLVWCKLSEEHINLQETLHEVDFMAARNSSKKRLDKDLTVSPLLSTQQRMLNAFSEGLSSVLPLEVFALFTGLELREMICGHPDVDVDLLRRVVEYEGYDENDTIIKYFWEVLREMTRKQRKLFLQFVWARSRLPTKEIDFEAPFKIQKYTKDKNGDTNAALPSASTCFFSLSLPEYKDKTILRSKLLFAINNVTTMESDYVTNDAEIGEGWRGM